ncbi:FecR domain-containing protein [Maribacter sp. MMG018]|uniref:FecR family protein n=1 Tax=Maribacter sp. MMG018 TaxID=2822688 RepID=UPI001B3843A6|nr:FecR domain-containing protein [Maribacter sp. MMG018]MBQ4913862.1 FecR domain-containing protein [Maribacter sp. MMG018]
MIKHHLLIDKFINRTISSKEREVLKKWVLEDDANMVLFKNRIKESGREISHSFDSDLAYQKFLNTIKSKKQPSNLFRTVFKYAAVIVILLAIGILVKQELINDVFEPSITVTDKDAKVTRGNEIVIKLADGTTKILNSESNEVVTDTKGNIIANQGGNSLVFNETEKLTETETVFNEIYIPYGHTFKLKLSDGTLVWLNAGSKLRFPQKFISSDKERIVYLEGEAFFEVAKNKEQPFIVNTQEVDIKVLGTKFNISSYETDNLIATTLVEGSVSVYETRTPENAMLLTPSFQARYDKFGNNFSKSKVDTSIYTAWMQNKLVIDNLTFSEILAKLERRHHVKFINKLDSLNEETYKGEFDNEGIESILKTISLSTPFKYKIEQNVITITQ